MKYLVNPTKIENDFVWEVYEVETEHVVDRFFFEDDALDCANFLERGGGFDGWTPSFILREVVVAKDVNQEFSAVFG